MPLTVSAAIPTALLAHLAAFAEGQSPEIAVAYPGRDFTPTPGEPYLEATWLPNRTETRAIGSTASQRHLGLLQIAVMWPRLDAGLIDAAGLAGEVLAHFAKGTRLDSDGTRVAIDRAGWLSPPLHEPDRIRLPVSVPYVCLAAD